MVTVAMVIIIIKAFIGSAIAKESGEMGVKGATKITSIYRTQGTHPTNSTLGGNHGDITMQGRHGDSPPHAHFTVGSIPPLNPAQIDEIGRNCLKFITNMLWKCLKQAFTDYIQDEIRNVVLDQLSKKLETIRKNRDLIGIADEIYFIVNEILLVNNIQKATISACSLTGRMIAYNLKENIEQETKKPLMCNVCDGKLRYIDKYGSWWCDSCEKYDIEIFNPTDIRLTKELDRVIMSLRGSISDNRYDEILEVRGKNEYLKSIKVQEINDHYPEIMNEKFLSSEEDEIVCWDFIENHSKRNSRYHGAENNYVSTPSKHYMEKEGGVIAPLRVQKEENEIIESKKNVYQYPCQKCGTILRFIYRYQMWWCDGCEKYIGEKESNNLDEFPFEEDF